MWHPPPHVSFFVSRSRHRRVMGIVCALTVAACVNGVLPAQEFSDASPDARDAVIVKSAADFEVSIVLIDENAASGTVVMDGRSDRRLHTDFRIDSGNECGVFEIDATTGRIHVADSENPDFETQPEFVMVVSARMYDAAANPFEDDFEASLIDSGLKFDGLQRLRNRRAETHVTVRLRDLNEPPCLAPRTFEIPESSAGGTSIGAVTGTDPDHNDLLHYTIVPDNNDPTFAIDPATGHLHLRPSAQLDFEHTSRYDLTVMVSDSAGLEALTDVSIRIDDIDEPPVIAQTDLRWIVDSDSVADIGTIMAADPDADGRLVFELNWDSTQGGFRVDRMSGIVSVVDPARIRDYADEECHLTINVRDNAGDVTQVPVNIAIQLPVAEPVLPVAANEKGDGQDDDPRAQTVSAAASMAARIVFGLSVLSALIWLFALVVIRRDQKVRTELEGSAFPERPAAFETTRELPGPAPEILRSQQGATAWEDRDDFLDERQPQIIAETDKTLELNAAKPANPERDDITVGDRHDGHDAPMPSRSAENQASSTQSPVPLATAPLSVNSSSTSGTPEPVGSCAMALDDAPDDGNIAVATLPQSEPVSDGSLLELLMASRNDTGGEKTSAAESSESEELRSHARNLAAFAAAAGLEDVRIRTATADASDNTELLCTEPVLDTETESPETASTNSHQEADDAVSDYLSLLLTPVPGVQPNRRADDAVPSNDRCPKSAASPDDTTADSDSEAKKDRPDEPTTVYGEFNDRRSKPRELLRAHTLLFREISKRAADTAIASAHRRRSQRQKNPRMILMGLLISGSVAAMIATLLNIGDFGLWGQLLLLAVFCSTAEFRLFIHRWRPNSDAHPGRRRDDHD